VIFLLNLNLFCSGCAGLGELKTMYHDVIMAGFGGQGILMIGDILALAGMYEGRHVTWMPSYGVEMRGGTARCTVVISDERVGSPITGIPRGCLVMNKPSLDRFESWVAPNGLLVANAAFIKPEDITRTDIAALLVPTIEIANEVGDARTASMVALGAYMAMSGVVEYKSVVRALEETFSGKKAKLVPINAKAVTYGGDYARRHAQAKA
jgi:2-oxoglutarate ferredoxin oxidoreductase subunit gamma